MQAGMLLKIYQHLKRLGITAEVSATGEQVTIRTTDMTACYDFEEIVRLAQQAPSWKVGQSIETILW